MVREDFNARKENDLRANVKNNVEVPIYETHPEIGLAGLYPTYGKGVDQQKIQIIESGSADLVNQGKLPALDLGTADGKPIVPEGGPAAADGPLRIDDLDGHRYFDGTPKPAMPLKPPFAMLKDPSRDDKLQELPKLITELPISNTKPLFAAPPDGAGKEGQNKPLYQDLKNSQVPD